ncbi:hypothetical protein M8864_33025, partial [Pseudomonas aeruginosa]|uniref:hypothetical protein n=1 Tax=Pseudomonas aeruginosa TaxID=287 RepID=UPI0020203F7A
GGSKVWNFRAPNDGGSQIFAPSKFYFENVRLDLWGGRARLRTSRFWQALIARIAMCRMHQSSI